MARQGLLPDSFDLKAQLRNPVPINPATLLPGVVDYLELPPLFTSRWLADAAVGIHLPGELKTLKSTSRGFRCTVAGWPDHPWCLLVSGLRHQPQVKIDERLAQAGSDFQWLSDKGWLIVSLEGSPRISVDW